MSKNHQTIEGNQPNERTSHSTNRRISKETELRELTDGNKEY